MNRSGYVTKYQLALLGGLIHLGLEWRRCDLPPGDSNRGEFPSVLVISLLFCFSMVFLSFIFERRMRDFSVGNSQFVPNRFVDFRQMIRIETTQ